MDFKRRFVTAVLGSVIAAASSTGGFAETNAECLARCGLTFNTTQMNCPSPLASDVAHQQCVQNATDTHRTCVNACPKDPPHPPPPPPPPKPKPRQ